MKPAGVTLLLVGCSWAVGCGSKSPPPTAADPPAGRAAVHRVVQAMQAKLERQRAAWDRSVGEGKTPTPIDFYFVEVASLQEADLAGCPPDFVAAFRGLIAARQRQLRAAERYKAEVPRWEAWTLIERQGDAPDLPAHAREIVGAAAGYDAAWQTLGAVCAKYQ